MPEGRVVCVENASTEGHSRAAARYRRTQTKKNMCTGPTKKKARPQKKTSWRRDKKELH